MVTVTAVYCCCTGIGSVGNSVGCKLLNVLFSLLSSAVVVDGGTCVDVKLSVDVCAGRWSELNRLKFVIGAVDATNDDDVGGTIIGDGVLNIVAESRAARRK